VLVVCRCVDLRRWFALEIRIRLPIARVPATAFRTAPLIASASPPATAAPPAPPLAVAGGLTIGGFAAAVPAVRAFARPARMARAMAGFSVAVPASAAVGAMFAVARCVGTVLAFVGVTSVVGLAALGCVPVTAGLAAVTGAVAMPAAARGTAV
jgi:hypothetical protein